MRSLRNSKKTNNSKLFDGKKNVSEKGTSTEAYFSELIVRNESTVKVDLECLCPKIPKPGRKYPRAIYVVAKDGRS